MLHFKDEKTILNGLINRDESIFKALVDIYSDYVLNICYYITGNYHDAQDITQEVFIEVFHSSKSFRQESKLSTWIHRIAINKSLNYIRSKKKFKLIDVFDKILGNEENHPVYSHRSDEAEYPAEQEEMNNILYSAIDLLSDNQRIAFCLHKIDGMPYKEISEIMDMSLSSVESLIHRAKLNLQRKLYRYYKKNNL